MEAAERVERIRRIVRTRRFPEDKAVFVGNVRNVLGRKGSDEVKLKLIYRLASTQFLFHKMSDAFFNALAEICRYANAKDETLENPILHADPLTDRTKGWNFYDRDWRYWN